MDEEKITIALDEYEDLLDDSLLLSHLVGAGVDNWDGWDDAYDSYVLEKMEEGEDE